MKKEMTLTFPTHIDPNWRIGIVASSYYKEEIDGLIDGATKTLIEAGIGATNIIVHQAPGSFEIPLIGAALAEAEKVDALIGFGIIVEGKTHHARLLAEAATTGIMETQLTYNIPFAFEVLYVNDLTDATERSIGPSNKGIEAALAVLHTLATLHAINE